MKKTMLVTLLLLGFGLLSACGGGSSGGSNGGGGGSQPAATHFSVTAPTTATVANALNFTVTAVNASNTVASSYTGTVHFSSTDAHAVLPSNSTLVNGVGSFTVTLKTAGGQTITASDAVTPTINGVSDSIEVSGNAPTGEFTATGSMEVARESHTATRLNDGTVLITGGRNTAGPLATAEIYDPASGAFSSTGSMEIARVGHTATLLKNGKVLVAGGGDGPAEIYTPATHAFNPTGSLEVRRNGHTATLLNDGRVLVAGGGTATAELFDLNSAQFTMAGDMSASRIYHTASLLPNGTVLIVGGTDSNGTALGDLFDPTTATFATTATGGTQSLHLAAATLQDGSVFFAGGEATVILSGGSTRCCVSGPFSSALAILYDNSSGTFTEIGDMSAARSSLTATLISGGEVLVAGGATITSISDQTKPLTTVRSLASAELFNPTSGSIGMAGSMLIARAGHTATLLSNEKVLVVGGVDANGNATASAELFQ